VRKSQRHSTHESLWMPIGPPGPPGRSGSRPNLEREWQLETLVRALQEEVRQLRQEVDDLKAGQQAN
jgi:hypothetical protein